MAPRKQRRQSARGEEEVAVVVDASRTTTDKIPRHRTRVPIPKDVLMHIVSLLDHRTTVAFARASHLFLSAAERALAREINLVLDPRAGQYIKPSWADDGDHWYSFPGTDESEGSDEDRDEDEEDLEDEDGDTQESEEGGEYGDTVIFAELPQSSVEESQEERSVNGSADEDVGSNGGSEDEVYNAPLDLAFTGGAQPLGLGYGEAQGDDGEDDSEGDAENDEAAGTEERTDMEGDLVLPPRFQRFLLLGKERHAKVEKARIGLGPMLVEPIISVLQVLSPTLCSLELVGPPQVYLADCRRVPAKQCLDIRWLTQGLTFPALDSFRLNMYTLCYVSFIPTLLHSAPNLRSLDLDIDYPLSETPHRWRDDTPPFNPSISKLERLRLNFQFYEDDPHGTLITLRVMLETSSKVRQLSLHYNARTNFVIYQLNNAAQTMPGLEDLSWQMKLRHLGMSSYEGQGFRNLRRIISRADHWPDLMQSIPVERPFPKLEIIYVNTCTPAFPSLPVDSTSTLPPQSMLPEFAKALISCPRLRHIHLLQEPVEIDDLEGFDWFDIHEQKGDFAGYIHSYHHGEDVLLHAHILTDYVEVWDVVDEGDDSDDDDDEENDENGDDGEGGKKPAHAVQASYFIADETERKNSWEKRDEPVWVDLTDYKGKVVPLFVIEAMREAQESSVEEWRGRGVEVGDQAWKIMTDYLEMQASILKPACLRI